MLHLFKVARKKLGKNSRKRKGNYREKPADIDAIAECIERLSQLVTNFDEITELDINPLIVFEKGNGAKVVDARILIKDVESIG